MYLPTSNEEQRKEITSRFMEYRQAAQKQLWDRYAAFEHWAKIEVFYLVITSKNFVCSSFSPL